MLIIVKFTIGKQFYFLISFELEHIKSEIMDIVNSKCMYLKLLSTKIRYFLLHKLMAIMKLSNFHICVTLKDDKKYLTGQLALQESITLYFFQLYVYRCV